MVSTILTAFFPAVGFAWLNSFWQMGILYGIYLLLARYYQQETAAVRHQLGLTLFATGIGWMIATGIIRYFEMDLTGANADFENWQAALPWESGYYALGLFYLGWIGFELVRSAAAKSQKRPQLAVGKIPVQIRLLADELACAMSITRKPKLSLTHQHQVPGVQGWWKPVVLIPAALVPQLSLKQWEAILIHELAHIKRNDFLYYVLTQWAARLLPLNPFAKALLREINITREMACDEWVINFGHQPFDYAATLLQLEEQRTAEALTPALAATKNKHQLLRRMEHLQQHRNGINPEPNQVHQTIKLLLTLSLTLGFLFGVPFWASEKWTAKAVQQGSLKSESISPLERMRWISAPLTRIIPEPEVASATPAKPTSSPAITPVTYPKSTTTPAIRKAPIRKVPQASVASEPTSITLVSDKLLQPEQPEISPVNLSNPTPSNKKWILVEAEESGSNERTLLWLETDLEGNQLRVEPLIWHQSSQPKKNVKTNDSTFRTPPSSKTPTAKRPI